MIYLVMAIVGIIGTLFLYGIGQPSLPTAVYYLGPSGGGKTTHADYFWGETINADRLMSKKLSPQNLLDPTITAKAYPKYKRKARRHVLWCILLRRSFVLDDTAIDVLWTSLTMRMARLFGFYVILVQVEASLEDCLVRNDARERRVHPERLREIHSGMPHSSEVLSPLADEVMYVRT